MAEADSAPLAELPEDWFEEESGQTFVLDPSKVLAEINALRSQRASLVDTIAIAVVTSAGGGWLQDDGAQRELARRAYAFARVMIEERERS